MCLIYIVALPGAEGLVRKVLGDYPTNPALVVSSFTSSLLRRLASVLFALPPDLFSAETVRHIGRYKVYVEDALPVLILLCSADFSTCNAIDPSLPSAIEDPQYDNEEFSGFLVRNKKQKKLRRKTKSTPFVIDVKPFNKLGAKVPLNNSEASQMACEIRDDLKMILKVCPRLLPS